MVAFAVEQAWNAGIVVVVAAGNDGNDNPLRNPATDPFVIAVGAADGHGGQNSHMRQTDFSSCGDWTRPVDLLAPGKSIAIVPVTTVNANGDLVIRTITYVKPR